MNKDFPLGFRGSRKAALFLLSIGKEEAAKILSHLDEKMIESIIQEMSGIKTISKSEREEVLRQFKEEAENEHLIGGMSVAKEILAKSVGNEKADELLQKLNKKDIEKDFEFLNGIDPQTLHSLMGQESPQTIAVTLSFLHPKKAAETLKFFSSELQSKIAIKLANTSKTHPDAILEIARVLKKKYEARDSEFNESGGAESLASILNHMDKNLEENILKNLETHAPELAGQVKEKLYVFEDILNLDNKEMRILINKVNNDSILTTALRGASEEMKKKFFNSVSLNRASDIIDSMETGGKITLREINQARNEILNAGRELEDEKLIVFKKSKEDYI